MDQNQLEQIIHALKSIKSNLPSETDMGDVERKLSKLIDISEKQLEVSEQILEKLDAIYDVIPSDSLSTNFIESKLDNISDKLDDANQHLSDIAIEAANG